VIHGLQGESEGPCGPLHSLKSTVKIHIPWNEKEGSQTRKKKEQLDYHQEVPEPRKENLGNAINAQQLVSYFLCISQQYLDGSEATSLVFGNSRAVAVVTRGDLATYIPRMNFPASIAKDAPIKVLIKLTTSFDIHFKPSFP